MVLVRNLLDGYYRLIKFVMTSMLALLLVPVTLQVVARYSDLIPRYIWTEEISRFAFIWIIMLGAIIAVRDETHFVVDILPALPRSVERWLRILTLSVLLIAGVVFTVGGWKFAAFGSIQHSELAGLPMLAIYIAWPVLGVSWIVFLLEKIVLFISSQHKSR